MVRNGGGIENEAAPSGSQVGFDAEGPRLGPVRLTRKKAGRWVPAEQVWLEQELVKFALIEPLHLQQRLDAVCRAMNAGDFATAAIATEHLTQPLMRAASRRRTDRLEEFVKASPDDPKRPGWPAGSPDGKGGEFRPIEGSGAEDRAAKRTRLAARRGLRSMLRRILTTRRVARILAELFGEAVPGLDEISGPATVIDALKLESELGADAADTEAAIAFLEKEPQAVEDLQVSTRAESFSSYSAFRKEDLARRFGSAGEGYEYHHIVEQGPNAANLFSQDLNSTTNIIKLPRLIHEDVTSYFAQQRLVNGEATMLRQFLRGKSFDEQRRFGLDALRAVGAIR